ncbi:hypothetical protein FQR65_LT10503 [Abscondita terminalis]|nr:hypothetical protein FQR65_LT10503 [Abscondita terminalis]
MDNNEYHLNKKLDAEFRRILRIIKPYIPCIMNNEYLTSYRLWLEKLSSASPAEKEERNRYIMELCYQIQDGILEYPFLQLPQDGPLPPFSPKSSNTKQASYTSPSLAKNTYDEFPQQHVNHDEGADDGSWYDITDTSASTVTKLGSDEFKQKGPLHENTQELYESKIAELMNIINDLQKQNMKLNESMITYEQAITMRNNTAENSIHNLVGEVHSLKNRLQELRDIKAALKNSQTVATNQWQTTISALTGELDSVQQQNKLLKNEIVTLEKKITDICNQQQNDNTMYRQKLNALQEKEMEVLKQNHYQQIRDLENKFNIKLGEVKAEYDRKMMEVQSSYEKIIHEKNQEIRRLENLIEVQCKRMHDEVTTIRTEIEESRDSHQNESNSEKIVYLQRCISKMDKLFRKSEKNYLKQIAKLKTEIEMKDTVIHIQLSSQRAELIANTNAERQIELDSTIEKLEERYRKLLEGQQNYFMTEKKHDTNLISDLRAVIAQNNIDCDL